MPHMLKNILSNILSSDEVLQVYSAFDQIGDIVIIKIPNELMPKKKFIMTRSLLMLGSEGGFAQVSPVRGDYRVSQLGVHCRREQDNYELQEHGCRFRVDVAKTYFSPRLSTERPRIANMVGEGETIVNMFAGGHLFDSDGRMNKTCSL